MSRNRYDSERLTGSEIHFLKASISRRRFLLRTVCGGALTAFVPSAVSASPTNFRHAVRWITENFQEIRDLGAACRRKGASEIEAVSNLLNEHREMPDELLNTLSRRIKNDFANDRVVVIDGWVVTETEAAFCAYCAIVDPFEL